MTSNNSDTPDAERPLFKAKATRRAVALTDLVTRDEIVGGHTRLRLFRPALASVDLVDWLQSHRVEIDTAMREYGGVLFRGFEGDMKTLFSRFVSAAIPEILQYMEGATPRTRLGDGIYTSTEFPRDQTIAQHNELSYIHHWPMRISFACKVAAERGGETPFTDVRQVLAQLDPELVRRFESKGWMLIRNYGLGLGPDWRKAYNTNDLDAVRRYCKQADIALEVFDDERIRTRQIRRAIRHHPVTGEAVWFNHVAFWHPSSLPAPVRLGLEAQFAYDELPYATCWGDGERIDDEIIEHINQAYRGSTLATPWRRGDIVLLDNMLIAHGRNPFKGSRSILVAMGQPYAGD